MDRRELRWAAAMQAGQTGSRAPYEAFLVELSASLRRIIAHQLFSLGLDASETEDVVQEVLIAVHSHRSSWDQRRPLIPWLNAITRYKILDAARRLRRKKARHIHSTNREWDELFITDEAHDHQRPTDIDFLVSLLPDKQQAVVRAVGLEGHSPRQAAQHLGISESAVRVAFHRSLKRLSLIGGNV